VSKFVKVMPRILWPLFFRTRCIYPPVTNFIYRVYMPKIWKLVESKQSYCDEERVQFCDAPCISY